MGLRAITLQGADLQFDPHWLDVDQADALFAQLQEELPWGVHRVRLFGREVDAPRLSCWIGDAGAHYRYSGVRYAPHPWPACLRSVRRRLDEMLVGASSNSAAPSQGSFNSVLANRYRDGRDAMGWHSDDEAELGPQPLIASLSLGATRRFRLKPRDGDGQGVALDLGHGSLLLMRGDTQRRYRHALPRTAKPVGERINLTFRRIVSGADLDKTLI